MIELYNVLNSIENINRDEKENTILLKEVEKSIVALYHQLELLENDAVGMVKIAKRLRNLLKERREYKNNNRYYLSLAPLTSLRMDLNIQRITDNIDNDMIRYKRVTREKMNA